MPISVASPRSGLAAPLAALVRAALASQSARAGDIGILLTTDAEMRALNRRWRRINRATDVLSFGYGDDSAGAEPSTALLRAGRPPRRAPVDGDLVISLDRVRAQARRYRVSEAKELARLTVHGALHLAGLDHQRAAERTHMRAVEDRVLRGARAATTRLERGFAGSTR